jgi:hypothetical protein
MIIHAPEISFDDGEVCVAARIELERQAASIPPNLWFRFPQTYREHVCTWTDGFLAGLILLSMSLQEDIQVRGNVSPRLAYGVEQFQWVFNTWLPDTFHRVNVSYQHLEPQAINLTGSGIGASFSGGVDSSFTLMQHLPPRQPRQVQCITHCVFVQGFDIPLGERQDFQSAVVSLSGALSELGVQLVPCRTNLQMFTTGRVDWKYAHGSALISPALVLQPLFRRYLISSSWNLRASIPWGSSVFTDHWLSTDNLEIVHYGLPFRRIEKIDALVGWEPAQRFLRVCTNLKERHGVENCSHCEKCLRTMAMMTVVGGLEAFSTFRKPFRKVSFLRWYPDYYTSTTQMIAYMRQHKKYRCLPFLILPFSLSYLSYLFRWVIPRRFYRWIKKKIYPAEKNPFRYKP